jgi:hypothetical protein
MRIREIPKLRQINHPTMDHRKECEVGPTSTGNVPPVADSIANGSERVAVALSSHSWSLAMISQGRPSSDQNLSAERVAPDESTAKLRRARAAHCKHEAAR